MSASAVAPNMVGMVTARRFHRDANGSGWGEVDIGTIIVARRLFRVPASRNLPV